MTDKELVLKAIEAMKNSYSPYSDFKVGSALLTESGKVYTGCNIENVAFGPSICAERVAFFKAISEGEKNFSKIAVVGGKGGIISSSTPPCGVCRQVMREFCSDDFEILIVRENENYGKVLLQDLLPYSFKPEILSK
ncbi:MAG: cytidine deaminase [Ruminococcaceae bacterium]|nr:cytidine deaminase [Oscillospiraceae bacterium]